jgi:predicted HD superfamily hydrolase involved in NAD metabolism
MTFDEVQKHLSSMLTPKRFEHSIATAQTAFELAHIYGANEHKAMLSGLIHDITKDLDTPLQLHLCEKFDIILSIVEKGSPKLLHAMTAPGVIKNELGISDAEILRAVRYHTTAHADMTVLEKVLYLADFVEPKRNFKGVEALRRIVGKEDLDTAMLVCLDYSINELLTTGRTIHPDTVDARNYIILNR